jgi:hypothetical protein
MLGAYGYCDRYLATLQIQNSSLYENSRLYEAIQKLNSGTKSEQEVAFLQLKGRVEPLVKEVLQSYINTLEPQVADTYKLLKYFLALHQWQEAKEESENILHIELGREITAIHYEESALITFENISGLWEVYAVTPESIKAKETSDFWVSILSEIFFIRNVNTPDGADLFSRRSYSESHE